MPKKRMMPGFTFGHSKRTFFLEVGSTMMFRKDGVIVLSTNIGGAAHADKDGTYKFSAPLPQGIKDGEAALFLGFFLGVRFTRDRARSDEGYTFFTVTHID